MSKDKTLGSVKRLISKKIDYFNLLKNYRNEYTRYYSSDKAVIYGVLKEFGIKNIKPVQVNQWKLWYNTCYFSGYCRLDGAEKQVFIKVNGNCLSDCHANELSVNEYIKTNSEYLYGRLPKILFHKETAKFFIIVYEYVELSDVTIGKELCENLNHALSEYKRIGILHTDFGLSNVGRYNGKVYFFDYGTSLCELSDNIRIRDSDDYNQIERAPSNALDLLSDATFYYDDIGYLGIECLSTEDPNFIISNNEIAYAKLGDRIVKYKLYNRPNSKITILNKQSLTRY